MKRCLVLFAALLGMGVSHIDVASAAGVSGKTGVNGIDIYHFAVTANNVVFAAGDIDAGIIKSVDQGRTWVPAKKPPGIACFVSSLVITPDGSVYASTCNRIYKSADEGERWSDVTAGIPKNTGISRVVYTGGALYALTMEGLFKATADGRRWRSINRKVYFQSLVALPNKTLLGADGGQTPIISTDQARTWKVIDTVPEEYKAGVLSIMDLGGNTLLAAIAGPGVLKSSDGGRHWDFHGDGISGNLLSMVRAITVTHDGMLYAGIDDKLYRSADRGNSWTLSSKGLPQLGGSANTADRIVGPQVWAVTETGDGTLLVGGRSGIFRSDDRGRSWSPALKINIDPHIDAPR
jgi:photosystem II stability/assembly factor-like uncharacterized protein